MSQKFTREIKLWDSADGIRRMYVLKGPRGAVVLTVFTDRAHETKELVLGIDIHSRAPLPYQSKQSQEHCVFLDNAPCWCDGSATAGDELRRVYNRRVHGEHVIWQKLQKWYDEHFGINDNADAGDGV
jgi:hypothetical protein